VYLFKYPQRLVSSVEIEQLGGFTDVPSKFVSTANSAGGYVV
jgi:hypothetical protein